MEKRKGISHKVYSAPYIPYETAPASTPDSQYHIYLSNNALVQNCGNNAVLEPGYSPLHTER